MSQPIQIYCLPWTDKAPAVLKPTSSEDKSKLAVTFDVQENLEQILFFTGGHWPKEPSDVEITLAYQTHGNTSKVKVCSLTPNQRCFLWSETKAVPTKIPFTIEATLTGSSLILPKSPTTSSISEGLEMQKINEKTPEITVSPLPEIKGKRKSEKENVLTTPKLKSRRHQAAMRAPMKKSPLNKTHTNSPARPSSVGGNVDDTTTKISRCVDLSARAPQPSSRWGHTLCMVNDNMAVLIGGQGDKQQFCRDSVWTLNPEMRSWKSSDVKTNGTKAELRVGHTATYDPTMRCIYIFGGSKKSKWFHDVYMYDLDEQKWTLVKANGKAPTRAYHSTTLYRHELWIFGGVYPRPSPQPDASDNEIHIFSPLMEGWYKPIVTGEKPLVRSGHSATLMNDSLVVFGGWDFPYCYNDIHILDLTTVDWSAPTVNGTPPKPRSWHASSGLSNNRIFIHGGYDGDNALQDAFVFNLDTSTWNELVLRDGPAARAGHVCIRLMSKYEKEDEDEIIVFGGGDNDGNYFNAMLSVYVPHHPVFA